MKYFIIIFYLISKVFASESQDIEGFWKTFDLKNQPRTIIKFYQVDNEYRADIYKILNSTNQSQLCHHCKGMNKNKLLEGMTIIQGLKFNHSEWKNGSVIDTDSGNTYGCQIKLSQNNKIMLFRAYIKNPLLGKTLRWERFSA